MATGLLYGSPPGSLYAADMAQTRFMGVEEARKVLGARVREAHDEGKPTVLTVHGQPYALIIPVDWYRAVCEALGESSELLRNVPRL